MDCPRCQLSLADAEYEHQQVKFCSTCWGYWLSRGQLESIVAGTTYQFGKSEARTVAATLAQAGDVDRQGSERSAAACPECGVAMQKTTFSAGCPVEVDECRAHGVWLDTGEIKDLQVFVEQRMR